MTRILLAVLAVVVVAGPALADAPHRLVVSHGPSAANRMAAHHHPGHCTIRHHHRICRR